MEEQKPVESQPQPQTEVPTTQQPTEHFTPLDAHPKSESSLYKKLFFALLALLIIGGIGFGAYSYGRNQDKVNMKKEVVQTTTRITETPENITPSPEPMKKDASLVPITEKTVSFARINGKIYLNYKGVIYDDSDQNEVHKADIVDDGNITWYGLVNRPDGVDTTHEELSDQIFSFKAAPNGEDFAFIMRWAGAPNTPQEQLTFPMYLYSLTANTGSPLSLLATYPKDAASPNYAYPKIADFDATGKYLSFRLFSCWNCGGHRPETLLMSLSDKKTKNIGRTSVFNWLADGKYQYKEYKVIPCEVEQMGECSEKPENLPFIEGQM